MREASGRDGPREASGRDGPPAWAGFGHGSTGAPAIVGHRGAPRRAPENTLASFTAAAEEGASWVELDARRSADGVVVVRHDPVTPDGRPVVAQRAQDLARWRVPTLAELLVRLPEGLGVDIECKNLPGEPDYDEGQLLAAMIAEVLAGCRPDHGAAPPRPVIVTSFNPLLLLAAASLLEGIPTGLLHSDAMTVAAGIDLAGEFAAAAVCPHVDSPDLGAEAIAAAHAAGLAVLVWTVEDAGRARALAAAGVDALCTDDPGGILAALGTGGNRWGQPVGRAGGAAVRPPR